MAFLGEGERGKAKKMLALCADQEGAAAILALQHVMMGTDHLDININPLLRSYQEVTELLHLL
ncbi:MAG: hypothetical protein KKA76_07630 [Proteobacteria bacterium]|nr:hypothetical protein [Pseudomonadota bacterium]